MPKQGPDWFLVATEDCGGGTPGLGSVLEVLGFIGSVGIGNMSGGPGGSHEEGGVPSTLVLASGLFWHISDTIWASSSPKIISVKFQVNWTPFGFPFLRYSKTWKKLKLSLDSRLIG